MEVRTLQAEDIIAIKDDLVEQRDMFRDMPDEVIKVLASIGVSFTCLDGDKVIACYGGIKTDNTWNAWAIYSNKASVFARARAAVILRKKLHEWKEKYPECKVTFDIPSDLPKGERYGDFLGGTFLGIEPNNLFAGVNDTIYEVN